MATTRLATTTRLAATKLGASSGANTRRDAAKESFWRMALGRQAASGLSARAFCQREGLAEPNFYAWRRTIQRRDQEAQSERTRDAVHALKREGAGDRTRGSVAGHGRTVTEQNRETKPVRGKHKRVAVNTPAANFREAGVGKTSYVYTSRGLANGVNGEPAFVPVRVTGAPTNVAPAPDSSIAIRLNSGHTLKLPASIPAAWLAELALALEAGGAQ